MEEWKEHKLGEVASLSTGFPFKGEKYSKDGIRVVRGDNVTIGELRWPAEKDKRWNEPSVRTGSNHWVNYTWNVEDMEWEIPIKELQTNSYWER